MQTTTTARRTTKKRGKRAKQAFLSSFFRLSFLYHPPSFGPPPTNHTLIYLYIYLDPLTADKEETALQLLEENNSLASESASQQNEHRAGLETSSKLAGLVVSGSGSLGDNHVIGRVELGARRKFPLSVGGGRESVDDATGLSVDSGSSGHGAVF